MQTIFDCMIYWTWAAIVAMACVFVAVSTALWMWRELRGK